MRIGGADVSALPVSRRGVGIVFQSYALFPNLTAASNVAYGLENGSGMRRREVNRRVEELLDLVGLRGLGGKFPAQLSGGQQQRVALARAMAPRRASCCWTSPFPPSTPRCACACAAKSVRCSSGCG